MKICFVIFSKNISCVTSLRCYHITKHIST
uniref:Uncharacterized protein n=1 Tax=Arundo donax TaxID=35708 RepID=A0A0A8ZTW8_ARUDO